MLTSWSTLKNVCTLLTSINLLRLPINLHANYVLSHAYSQSGSADFFSKQHSIWVCASHKANSHFTLTVQCPLLESVIAVGCWSRLLGVFQSPNPGIACAWSLSRFPERFEVEVWEALPVPGGVASSLSVKDGESRKSSFLKIPRSQSNATVVTRTKPRPAAYRLPDNATALRVESEAL